MNPETYLTFCGYAIIYSTMHLAFGAYCMGRWGYTNPPRIRVIGTVLILIQIALVVVMLTCKPKPQITLENPLTTMQVEVN